MKKFLKVMAVMAMVLVLTGCMKVRTNVVIKDEDNATMTMEILYAKEMMDSYNMDEDDLKDRFTTGDDSDSDFKDIKETIDGEEYVGFSIEAPKEETAKILDQLSVRDVNGKKEYTLEVTKDSLNESMDPSSLSGAQYSLEQMKDKGFEITMTVQMPGKITDATIGKVKGNTVTIDVLEATQAATKGTLATITSNEGGSDNAIFLYGAIGVGVIAVIAIAYVVISKKKKNTNNDENIVTIEEPAEVMSGAEAPSEVVEETVTPEVIVEETTTDETVNPEVIVEETTTEETVTPEAVVEETTIEETDTTEKPKEETDN